MHCYIKPTFQADGEVLGKVRGKDNAIEVIANEILETVSRAIGLALGKLAGFVEVVVGSLGYLIDNVLKKMHEEVKNGLWYIDTIIQEAQDAGIDPKECVGTSIEDLNTLPDLIVSDVRTCVREK